MRLARMQRSLCWGLLFCLLLMLIPLAKIKAQGVSLEISIGGNQTASVSVGSVFAARLNINSVTDLAGYEIVIKYDPGVIIVTGVSPGRIDQTEIPLEAWTLLPGDNPTQGRVFFFGHYPQQNELNHADGSGYLAEIQFQTIGSSGQSSDIIIERKELRDTRAELITAGAVVSASVNLVNATSITSVTTDTADGAYSAGKGIDFEIVFNRAVFVNTGGGIPKIELNTGGEARYLSGTGTNSLIFRYMIENGHNSVALDYLNTGSLKLAGGTIRDSLQLDAFDILPDAGAFTAAHHIIVDTTVPTVTLTSDKAGYFNSSPLYVTAAFSEDVTGFNLTSVSCINGTPSELSGGPAVYHFIVTPFEQGTLSCELASGAAADEAGNSSTGNQPLILVYDITSPVITAVGTSNTDGTYIAGDVIEITLQYSEIVNVDTAAGIPSLSLNTGGKAYYTSGSGRSLLTLQYEVANGQSTNGLDYLSVDSLILNGGIISDRASNISINTLPPPGIFSGAHSIIITDNSPAVVSVNPDSGAQNTRSLIALIKGHNLGETTSVIFGAGINVSSFTVDNSNTITVVISVDKQAAPGARTVMVAGAGGKVVTLINGFKVVMRGDTDGDGEVGIGDVLGIELIMIGVNPPTPGADANGDGLINIADVITVELIMAGVIS